jgi:hypothetical protein
VGLRVYTFPFCFYRELSGFSLLRDARRKADLRNLCCWRSVRSARLLTHGTGPRLVDRSGAHSRVPCRLRWDEIELSGFSLLRDARRKADLRKEDQVRGRCGHLPPTQKTVSTKIAICPLCEPRSQIAATCRWELSDAANSA